MRFKKLLNDGLFTYLFTGQASAYAHSLHQYLSLAKRLTEGFNCYVLIRRSPFLSEVLPAVFTTDWHYQVQADDFQGLGTDSGFRRSRLLSNGNTVKEKSAFFPLKDLLTLQSFPEDTFGDTESQLSIFGLSTTSERELVSFMRTASRPPHLSEILRDSELFIHLSCGKSSGHYDSVVINSVRSLDTQLGAVDEEN